MLFCQTVVDFGDGRIRIIFDNCRFRTDIRLVLELIMLVSSAGQCALDDASLLLRGVRWSGTASWPERKGSIFLYTLP